MSEPDQTDLTAHAVVGEWALRRTGRWRSPALEITNGTDTVARLRRLGWLRIVFGRGVRIDLADGTRWRLGSLTTGKVVCPVIHDAQGRRIAISGLGHGTYGITGKDYACVLVPAEARRFGRANRWILREHETEMAVVSNRPPTFVATEPVHLGAVILSIVLARYGVFGENALVAPAANWG
jgi:hypothetical protein